MTEMTNNPEWCSPSINEIAGALAKAQAGLGKLIASKTAKIPTKKGNDYSYTYANLADALDACRSTLNAEGIAIVQMPAVADRNGIEVRTMLVHSSGQWLRSDPLFMPVSGGAQDVGSAITYARRYQLLAMVGLSPEDDDGAKAQAAKPNRWRGQTEPREEPRCVGKAKPIADAIKRKLDEFAELVGDPPTKIWTALTTNMGLDPSMSPEQLTITQGKTMSAALDKWIASRQPEQADPTAEGAP